MPPVLKLKENTGPFDQSSSWLQMLMEDERMDLANNIKAFLQKIPEVAILLQEGEGNSYIKNW